MFQEYFARHPELMIWPLLGLVIFIASFCGVVLYVCLGLKDRRKVDYLASLPLQTDSQLTSITSVGRKLDHE
jgi:hypothetical protein